jgi:hypothetical protein
MAYRGKDWALGVTIALASIVVTAFVHAALFALIWIFARLTGTRHSSGQRPPR